MTEQKIADILIRFGWLAAKSIGPKLLAEAIKQFQSWYGLEPDGVAGPVTQRALTIRELCGCGNPDTQAARGSVCKWTKRHLRYFVQSTPNGVTAGVAKDIYRRSWQQWESVCGISVEEVDSIDYADIVVTTARGRRGGFDGRGGALAKAELPCSTQDIRLTSWFDLDEPFGESATNGRIALLNVACHEFGHHLGLDHINPGTKALMNPVYDSRVPAPLAADVAAVVSRYGQPAAIPAPNPQPGPAPTLPPGVRPRAEITISARGCDIIVNGSKVA